MVEVHGCASAIRIRRPRRRARIAAPAYTTTLVQQVATSIVSHWGAPLYLRPLSHRMGYGHGDGPLSASQIGAFKAEGYLILRGFLPLEDVDGWRESFWAHIQAQFPGFVPEDDRSWPDTKVIPGGFSVPFGAHPKMQAVVAQLGAGKLAGGGGGVLVNWPQGDAPADTEEALKSWSPSAQGHVDGYGPGGWSGGFTLAATTYLENVEPGGGGFTFWPRSHRAVHRFFRKRPELIDGSFYILPEWSDGGWKIMYDREEYNYGLDVGEATEFIGRKGDVILWHNFLCHTGSTNVRKGKPRLGIFSRWHHVDMYMGPPNNIEPPDFEPLDSELRRTQLRYETPADLWKMWSLETQAVPTPKEPTTVAAARL